MSEPMAVYIVDDEESIRKAVGFTLRTSGYRVQSWSSGVAFLKEVRNLPMGCVLLDVRMPDMDGLEVQALLAARGVCMPVVVLTGHGDVAIAVRAMKGGAVDFLEKPFERSVLLQSVATAFARIDQAERHREEASVATRRLASLTPRETEVLVGLSDGLPNKSIAYDLGISARTVEVHRANIMIKLGAASFPEALRVAFAAGLGRPAAAGVYVDH
jgi:two-component system response regulator FixJ